MDDVHAVNGTLTSKELKKFFDDIIEGNSESIFSKIYIYNSSGKNLVKIVENLIDFIKNILLYYEAPNFLKDRVYDIGIYSNYEISNEKLIGCINIFNDCLNSMKKTNNFQLVLEMSILSILDFLKNNKNVSLNDLSIQKNIENKDKNNNVSSIHKIKFDDTLLKNRRVENTLSHFNKSIVRSVLNDIPIFKKYLLDSKYGKYASLILDGKLKAASDEYLIFVFDNADVSNSFNRDFMIIEEFISKVLSKQYKVVSVPVIEWDEIRDLFNSKKKQFIYSPENGQFDNMICEKNDDEIANMFGDIVEYK